eukprot:TRINITY_DN335_c0_g1_i3.p3 TRINITY_DN335_c0_g1~~TRINITY_DN335_c0_g1_i3.p3  ORF type:complete len:102 (-),score=16.92 TRINITY_DN335_c0_g1_i3:150-455(-)
MQAQTQTQVIINQANASAYTMVQAAEGKASAMETRLRQQGEALKQFKDALSLDAKALIAFQYNNAIDQLASNSGDSDPNIKVNLGIPSKIQCMYDPTKITC